MKRITLLVVVCLALFAGPVYAAPTRPQPNPNGRNGDRQAVFWACVNGYAARTGRNINQIKGDEARRVIAKCRYAAVRYGGK